MSRQQQYDSDAQASYAGHYGPAHDAYRQPPHDAYRQPPIALSHREGRRIAEVLDKLDTAHDNARNSELNFEQFKKNSYEDSNKIREDIYALRQDVEALTRKIDDAAPPQAAGFPAQAVESADPNASETVRVDQLNMATNWRDFAGDRMPYSLYSDWKWWTFFDGPIFYPAHHPFFRGGHKPVRCRVVTDIKQNKLCHSFATTRKCKSARCPHTHICPLSKWDTVSYDDQYWWQAAFDNGDTRFSRSLFDAHMAQLGHRNRGQSQPANKKRKRESKKEAQAGQPKSSSSSSSRPSVNVDAPTCSGCLVPDENGIFMDGQGQILPPEDIKVYLGKVYCSRITGVPTTRRNKAQKDADFKQASECKQRQSAALVQQVKALTEQLDAQSAELNRVIDDAEVVRTADGDGEGEGDGSDVDVESE